MFETLLTHLGGPIARFLLKTYLGELGADVGGTFIDVAATRLHSALDQRRAARAFEDISEQILSRLTPLFEFGAQADDVNVESIALELKQTLSARLPLDDLVTSDLDPSRLSASLRTARPINRGMFSDAELSLYDRALDELVRYLVSTAASLPSFDVRVSAASLQRLTRVTSDLEQILARTERIERRVMGSLKNPLAVIARYEADYREAIVRELDKMELFGVEVSDEARRHPLTVAYIALNLKAEIKGSQKISFRAEAVFDQMDEFNGRLLIRGEAGSGKTTLLRWAAIQASGFLTEEAKVPSWADFGFLGDSGGRSLGPNHDAEQKRRSAPEKLHGRSVRVPGVYSEFESNVIVIPPRKPHLAPWRSRIPFFLPLRNCPDGRLPKPDELPSVIARLEGMPPADWVYDVLQQGRGMVLLDGVDEMPRRKRWDFRDDVRSLVTRFPRNMFVVSARPSAVPDHWLSELNFTEATVDPMSAVDQAQFIERWHIAVGRALADSGRVEERLPSLAKLLIERIRERPSLARLATNPLLCAMICALHRDRNEQIPTSEPALCDAACAMLLHRREQERDLQEVEDSTEYRSLSYEEKRFLIRHLAAYMVRNGYSRVDRANAENRISESLQQFPGKSGYDPGGILLGLIERSGILRDESPGSVDFVHNTLKEYLAAEQFVQQNDAGMLVKHYRDPSWQPVILFAVATNHQGFASEVVGRIMELDTKTDAWGEEILSSRPRNLFLLRCRAAALVLPPGLQQALQELVPRVLPPQTVEDARVVAAIGPTVAGQLRFQTSLSTNEASASIRALRLIGTQSAIEFLSEYRSDRRLPVVSELARAINPLEIDLVQDVLVKSGTVLDEVRGQIDDLSPLSRLTLPPELDLHGIPASNISVLARFVTLRKLNLSRTHVRDIGALAQLTMLEELDLSSSPIDDLEPLGQLTALRTLNLDHTQAADLTPLANLASLRTLSLVGSAARVITPVLSMLYKASGRIVVPNGQEFRSRVEPLPGEKL